MRGVTIILDGDEVHTGRDLDLVQEKKNISNPEIQSYLVEVPGRNGLLNLTKGLTGNTCYKNRSIELQYFGSGRRSELLNLQSMFNMYHGETVRIIDDDTPEYYYEGEATVNSVVNPNYITISLSINANPFMRAIHDNITTVELTEDEQEICIVNDGLPTTVRIVVEDNLKLMRGNQAYTLNKGTYELVDFELKRGANLITLSGSGEVSIIYKEERI